MSGPRMRPASDLMYSRRMPAGKFRITAKTAGSVTALSAMGFSFRASMKGMCGRKMSSMGVPRPEELEEGEQVLDDEGGWTGTAQRGRRPHIRSNNFEAFVSVVEDKEDAVVRAVALSKIRVRRLRKRRGLSTPVRGRRTAAGG